MAPRRRTVERENQNLGLQPGLDFLEQTIAYLPNGEILHSQPSETLNNLEKNPHVHYEETEPCGRCRSCEEGHPERCLNRQYVEVEDE